MEAFGATFCWERTVRSLDEATEKSAKLEVKCANPNVSSRQLYGK